MTKLHVVSWWFRATPAVLSHVSLSSTTPSGAVTVTAWKTKATGSPPGVTPRQTLGGRPLPCLTCSPMNTVPSEQVNCRSRAGLSACAAGASRRHDTPATAKRTRLDVFMVRLLHLGLLGL